MKNNDQNTFAGMSGVEHRLCLNGATYHVYDFGDGATPVLLLHGMPDTALVWRYQIKALVEAGYRVIAPDMLGYGKSDKPQEVARYEGEQLLADMAAMLEALSLEKFHVVGHDWGSFISWEMALALPDSILRHVTLSVGHPDRFLSAPNPEEVKQNWYMFLSSQEHAPELFAADDGAFLKRVFMPGHPELDEVWSRLKDPAALRAMLNWDRANPMAAHYHATAMNPDAPRPCRVPTLGIWSSGDTYLWEAQMKDTGRMMSASWRYELIGDASHWLMLDKPEETNRLILDWLGAS